LNLEEHIGPRRKRYAKGENGKKSARETTKKVNTYLQKLINKSIS